MAAPGRYGEKLGWFLGVSKDASGRLLGALLVFVFSVNPQPPVVASSAFAFIPVEASGHLASVHTSNARGELKQRMPYTDGLLKNRSS